MHRSAVSLLLALTCLTWVAAPAHAAEGGTKTGSILVIMDVSGSMKRTDVSGTTLIAGARRAVSRLVADAPPSTPVGLRLYGNTYQGKDKGPGCLDSQLVVPVAPLARSGRLINAAVGRARPTGFTPIGYSLQQAAKDFPPTGQRTIVLVSDGEDTCGKPTPCQVAKKLDARGIHVRVDTVGLFLQGNRKAQAQLRCVAATTGGKYYPADNTTALTKRLTTVSQRAVQRFQAAGTAVAGGAAATQATPIEQGTDYVDDIRPGEARFYSFPAGTGQVVASTLTEDGSTEYGCCLKLSVLDPSYNSVAYSNLYNSDGTAHSMRAASDNQGVADAGSYVLEVALSDDSAKRPVRYQFKVGVTGTALESTSPSPSASDSGSASSSASPSASSSAGPSASSSPSDAQSAGDTGGNTLLWIVLVGLFVLVLVAVAAVALALVRLRGRGAGPTP
jgi:hypothetical protein